MQLGKSGMRPMCQSLAFRPSLIGWLVLVCFWERHLRFCRCPASGMGIRTGRASCGGLVFNSLIMNELDRKVFSNCLGMALLVVPA